MNDREALWRTLYGEAEPWDKQDALAIGHVILNRVGWKNWPDNIVDVCFQPKQFSCWNDDNPRKGYLSRARPEKSEWTEYLYELAGRLIRDEAEPDPTNGATHYYATYAPEPRWARGKTPVFETDGLEVTHLFYNDIDTPAPRDAKEALDQARPLKETRSMRAAAGQTVVGGGSLAQGASEMTDAIEQGASLMDGRGLLLTIAGLAIIGLAAWQIWARMDDREQGRR
ncbi:cell wall hydrolase [Fodinicurvata sediminis]|uniref:cell wall hydrolase n=1 Tax=Fodinicurvata sediminis TaxID=1121832 RepID=UPI0003B4342D|nr:cell wall hydrolase [Fodinicurvata sediminis]